MDHLDYLCLYYTDYSIELSKFQLRIDGRSPLLLIKLNTKFMWYQQINSVFVYAQNPK